MTVTADEMLAWTEAKWAAWREERERSWNRGIDPGPALPYAEYVRGLKLLNRDKD